MFMNEYEIDEAVERHGIARMGYSVPLHRATLLLRNYKNAVNSMSDGWPYWSPASRAARRLMELIQHPPATEAERYADLAAAERALKSFCTRHASNGLTKEKVWTGMAELTAG